MLLDLDFSVCDVELGTPNMEAMDIQLEFEAMQQVTTSDHARLQNRDKPDQHPIRAITNLENTLGKKLESSGFLTNLEIQAILDL